MTGTMQITKNGTPLIYAIILVLVGLPACYTPNDSQAYFVKAASEDRPLEPIYSTSLYTVYFDYALQRCVIHSTHTWGQQGGGGGGTGIGIEAFRCDPMKIRVRARNLGLKIYKPRFRMQKVDRKPESQPRQRQTQPKATKNSRHPSTRQPVSGEIQ